MSDKNLKIGNDHVGRRIDNFLINFFRDLPKSKIYSMLRKGEIRVNSGRIKPLYKLKINDEIRIPPYLIDFKNKEPNLKIPPSRIQEFIKSIIYQNDDYILVNKDSELSVHSGTKNQFGLIDIARANFPLLDIDLCHRIDKSTSGCVLIAKNKLFLRHFNKQLKSNKVKKKYEAILFGVLDKDLEVKSKIDTIKPTNEITNSKNNNSIKSKEETGMIEFEYPKWRPHQELEIKKNSRSLNLSLINQQYKAQKNVVSFLNIKA